MMLDDRQARMTSDRPITFEDFCAVMRDLEKEDATWMEPDRYMERSGGVTEVASEGFPIKSSVFNNLLVGRMSFNPNYFVPMELYEVISKV